MGNLKVAYLNCKGGEMNDVEREAQNKGYHDGRHNHEKSSEYDKYANLKVAYLRGYYLGRADWQKSLK